MPRSESTGALDRNGFPVATGDLVAATAALSPELKSRQGVVVDISCYNNLHVQMEDKVLPSSDKPEILVASGSLWKLVAHGGD